MLYKSLKKRDVFNYWNDQRVLHKSRWRIDLNTRINVLNYEIDYEPDKHSNFDLMRLKTERQLLLEYREGVK